MFWQFSTLNLLLLVKTRVASKLSDVVACQEVMREQAETIRELKAEVEGWKSSRTPPTKEPHDASESCARSGSTDITCRALLESTSGKPQVPCHLLPRLVFATAHKTGTHLFEKIMKIAAGSLHCLAHDPTSSKETDFHDKVLGDILMFDRFSVADYLKFRAIESSRSYRLVYSIRDPEHMVVSAFLYHKSGTENLSFPDVPWFREANLTITREEDMNLKRQYVQQLRTLSAAEGLEMEFGMYEEHVFPRLKDVLRAVHNDPDVLIMDLAQFRVDFPKAIHQLFTFMFAKTGSTILSSHRVRKLLTKAELDIGRKLVGPSAAEDARIEAIRSMSTSLRHKLENVRLELLHLMHVASIGTILASPAELGRS